jgi:hypothetical protein
MAKGSGREASPSSYLQALLRASDKTDEAADEDVVEIKFALPYKIDAVLINKARKN